ncbi:acyltransferase [Marinobacter sp. SS5-14b]|uniref:acyltransferase family protein n=1 Tax=Marinobacter sp. SS5-14b TaxID=3050456 RepID=UPI0026DF0566|nr:acyltransferase [Marinobacter sp. SS5-14b]
MGTSRIFGLDFLRFMAIMLVVIGHGLVLMPSFGGIYEFFRVFDFLGVEFFFVLSGFLIGTIFLKTFSDSSGIKDLLYFWKRRWWRTLPNYYLFIVINSVGFSVLKDDFIFDWRYLFFLQNLIRPNEGFFSVSWSLTVEEWFYVTVPFIFLIFLRISKSKASAIWSTFLLVVIASFIGRHYYISHFEATWSDEMRRVALLRLDSLIYGVVAAWLWLNNREFLEKYKLSLFIAGTLLLGVGVAIRNSPEINQQAWMLLFLFPIISLGVSCWLPILSCWRFKDEGNSPLEKWVCNISLWSYSLYLVHVPAMEGFRIFILPKILDSPILQILTFAIWTGFAIFSSFLIYRFFEKPLTDLRDGRLDAGWIKSVISRRGQDRTNR